MHVVLIKFDLSLSDLQLSEWVLDSIVYRQSRLCELTIQHTVYGLMHGCTVAGMAACHCPRFLSIHLSLYTIPPSLLPPPSLPSFLPPHSRFHYSH